MNISDLIIRFRIASRELFNNFFSVSDPYVNDGWVWEERFRHVEIELFRQIVAVPTSINEVEYGYFQPNISVALSDVEFAPIQINRELDSGYWDFPVTEVDSNAKLAFIKFFDWDALRCRDNQYVRVKIIAWQSHPECVGKHALIEAAYVTYEIAP